MNEDCCAFHANEYDNKIKQTLPFYEEFYKQIIETVHICYSGSVTWLDVGCGTGKMAEAARKDLEIENFVCCDCSDEMIRTAQSRFHFSNMEFVNCAVQDLDYTRKFDVVTAIQVNHYLQAEERIEALKKCYKALKPGGLFFTYENYAPYSEEGKNLYLNRWKAYQLKQRKSMEECEKHVRRYGKDYFPITLSEHIRIMENSGFRTVELFWLSYMQAGFLGIK